MKTLWRIEGEELGSCNCAWGCPCQFNAAPTQGHCRGVVMFRVDRGHFGDTNLDRVTFGWLFSLPGAPHEGDGTMQLIVDEGTTDPQRQALTSINTAEFGGMPFEIYSAICPHKRDPVVTKMDWDIDREARRGRVHLPNWADVQVEPIMNPVTGEEQRARIVLPAGFEYKEAEMGNTVSMKATGAAPLEFEEENTYAQLNAFDWTNVS